MRRVKAKFRKGQVLATKDDRFFKVTEVVPCWDRSAPMNDTKPDRYEYRESWTHHREENCRALTRKEYTGRGR